MIIGLFAVNLDSGATVPNRSQDPFAMCSTFKTYAAARVLQMVERGQLTLDQKAFVDPAAIVADSPRTEPRAGTEMTLSELCEAALQVSDNTAANLLLHTIGGPQAIICAPHRRAHQLGAAHAADRILGRKPRTSVRGEPIRGVAGRSPAVRVVGLVRRCICLMIDSGAPPQETAK